MTPFERTIRLQLDRFGPEAAKAKHIEIAQRGLQQFLAKQSVKPQVMIETDGATSHTENTVRPFGIITYRFLRMREIVVFALAEARRISPVLTGRYRDSWFSLVGGSEVKVDDIEPNSVVLISNDQPYARKIHVGARGFEKHAGIVEKIRQAVRRKYGMLVNLEIQFVTFQGGYVLKKGLRKIHQGRRYGGIRNDAKEGSEITYPSLLITPKFGG